jgi:VIT1/CCC1 family predicted Fe2+/Mn2+ transporter
MGLTQAASKQDIDRYRDNLQNETDGAALYRLMAEADPNTELASVYRRLANAEEGHADLWRRKLDDAGSDASAIRPSAKVRVIGWLAKRFGAKTVIPIVLGMEAGGSLAYESQQDSSATSMARDERSHARIFRHIARGNRSGLSGPSVAQAEGRHSAGGGNALRAAVLGANDGLVSNFSLVMGVAGATLGRQEVLFTGLAGMLAGAVSMALGEWLSVQSSRELYERQIGMERAELEEIPDEERDELELIYQAKGLQPDQARALARQIVADPHTALDTLAREELGIDPDQLGGSAWTAAITSFLLFAVGAVIPVLPYLLFGGIPAVIASAILSGLALFTIGAGITIFTGRRPLSSGFRQVAFGLAAAMVTFSLGRLVGAGLGL